jgi:hypothetical protein
MNKNRKKMVMKIIMTTVKVKNENRLLWLW